MCSSDLDTSLSIGTSSTEALLIQVLNGTSNKTAEEIKFISKTASNTDNHGKFIFAVDETDKLEINDNGLTVTGSIGCGAITSTGDLSGVTGITFDNGATIKNTNINFNNTTSGDPDVVFNTETSVFQYFEDDYLENNPGTINNVITSYVGDYWSETVEGQHTLLDSEVT